MKQRIPAFYCLLQTCNGYKEVLNIHGIPTLHIHLSFKFCSHSSKIKTFSRGYQFLQICLFQLYFYGGDTPCLFMYAYFNISFVFVILFLTLIKLFMAKGWFSIMLTHIRLVFTLFLFDPFSCILNLIC